MAVAVLMRVPLDDAEGAASVLVEADSGEIPGGLVLASPEPGRAAATASRSLSASLEHLEPVLRTVKEKLAASAPAHFTVEFGVKFGGESGIILAKGTAEVNLKITMTWDKKRDRDDQGSDELLVGGYETATVRVRLWVEGHPATAGLGLLVGAGRVVTCAHVVNTALGRRQGEQAAPGESDVVQVEFPLLPGAPVRDARVVAWQPPCGAGLSGGDVAGLALTEDAPSGAVPARFMAAVPAPGTWLRVFGYPGDPPRPGGAFVDVDLKGQVTGLMLQVESRSGQTIKAQPGFSGSPVWNPATGEAAGLLQSAPQAGEPQRDAYLLPPEAIAAEWEDPFDYLLVPDNPYRGLEPFTAAYASVFFGRDDDIATLTERVRVQPVVIVVGPSGVGKSSLVQAGLIPALGESWSVALVRPGQDPWLRLGAGLLRAQHGTDAQVTQAACREEIDRVRAGGLGPVAEFVRSQDRQLLVVVDQFEEVLAGDGSPDPELLDLLLPQAGIAVQAARVVLTLRADYQSVLQSIPGFHRRLNDRLYLLSPLTSQQMSEAVQRPAAARGVGFEPGLADQIVADAADGALPVLEFTLTRLWQAQRRKTLTFAGYHAMGGVRGALDRFAEQQAAQLDDTAGLLDRVLLRLVRVPVGSPELATHQRAWKSQTPAAEWQVLERWRTQPHAAPRRCGWRQMPN